ncbi:hypothetical protein M378DRAFT_858118 [Amanita muscaria Koide BX008]|uniref:Uncharacterized protein n=1 Tax=Amanita muscaria (strain Koide BX008) TaxID=946122 RepID=A0A0C2SE88_AMAMK|nr:hypothetical protein M378DRAFT_858118 [Amanita muscaria Koide BX008]
MSHALLQKDDDDRMVNQTPYACQCGHSFPPPKNGTQAMVAQSGRSFPPTSCYTVALYCK